MRIPKHMPQLVKEIATFSTRRRYGLRELSQTQREEIT
ncbi:hypothetical protein KP509_30G055600 [Ceratopteris richardii]|uniref:Uncharacterized protein n=1 Tax=Ceratopteris richardii TaxID=49495 RepID=A0A8T2R458_CERRI|nr:hypothetical protein KP509_30G055600 [Ceratopteris richardii]